MFDSQTANVIEIDNEDDVSDEYDELQLPSTSLPSTPGIKRAYKGTSSVS